MRKRRGPSLAQDDIPSVEWESCLQIPIELALSIVAGILVISVIASLVFPKPGD